MTKKQANAQMRSLYGADWFDRPGAKAERAALMRGVAAKPKPKPKPRAAPRPKAAPAPKPRAAPPKPYVPPRSIQRVSHQVGGHPPPPKGVMLAKKWKGSTRPVGG